MTRRGAIMLPLLFAVIILIVGLFELGIYVYFHHLAFSSPNSLFSTTYSLIWAGGWNIFASLSLIFVLSGGIDKHLRRIRTLSLILFLAVLVVQSASWSLCEVFEFRLWLSIGDGANSTKLREEKLVLAYISSTAVSIVGISIGICGFFYIIVIFYALASKLFIRRGRNSINELAGTVTRGQRTEAGASSAPAALARQSSQTADSWLFVRFRHSTPKAKSDVIRQRYNKNRKRSSDLESVRRKKFGLEISEEELNRSAPLRLIASIHPQAFTIGTSPCFDDSLESPSLEDYVSPTFTYNNKWERGKRGNEMTTFFQDSHIKNLARDIGNRRSIRNNAIIHPAPPSSLPITTESNTRQEVRKFIAWRLPSIPKLKVAKELNFSQEAKQIENPQRSGAVTSKIDSDSHNVFAADCSPVINHF